LRDRRTLNLLESVLDNSEEKVLINKISDPTDTRHIPVENPSGYSNDTSNLLSSLISITLAGKDYWIAEYLNSRRGADDSQAIAVQQLC
jgi:hypothetical protein